MDIITNVPVCYTYGCSGKYHLSFFAVIQFPEDSLITVFIFYVSELRRATLCFQSIASLTFVTDVTNVLPSILARFILQTTLPRFMYSFKCWIDVVDGVLSSTLAVDSLRYSRTLQLPSIFVWLWIFLLYSFSTFWSSCLRSVALPFLASVLLLQLSLKCPEALCSSSFSPSNSCLLFSLCPSHSDKTFCYPSNHLLFQIQRNSRQRLLKARSWNGFALSA